MRLHVTAVAVALVSLSGAPCAQATTTVGLDEGAGPDAGAAIQVNGDRGRNDVRIDVSQPRAQTYEYTWRIVDPQAPVRVGKYARLYTGCHVSGPHTVICSKAGTALGTVHLGAGNDRLRVHAHHVTDAVDPGSLMHFPLRDGPFGEFLGWSILPVAVVERSKCKATVSIGDARYLEPGSRHSRLERQIVMNVPGPGC